MTKTPTELAVEELEHKLFISVVAGSVNIDKITDLELQSMVNLVKLQCKRMAKAYYGVLTK